MKNINDLGNALVDFFGNIDNGDKYIGAEPALEDGLQLDLYKYLSQKGFLVVYELILPNLKPYLDKELNESTRAMSSTVEDSLRPDLVVNLGTDGYVCIELKYNEVDETQCKKDAAKCNVYVKHCSCVYYSVFINLSKNPVDGYTSYKCKDPHYKYYVSESNRIKTCNISNALAIKTLWANRHNDIMNGNGKFAEYED